MCPRVVALQNLHAPSWDLAPRCVQSMHPILCNNRQVWACHIEQCMCIHYRNIAASCADVPLITSLIDMDTSYSQYWLNDAISSNEDPLLTETFWLVRLHCNKMAQLSWHPLQLLGSVISFEINVTWKEMSQSVKFVLVLVGNVVNQRKVACITLNCCMCCEDLQRWLLLRLQRMW